MSASQPSALAAFLGSQGLVNVDNDTFFDDAHTLSNKVRASLEYLKDKLINNVTDQSTDEEIQYWFYEAGKIYFKEELRTWFKILYGILFKQDSGSRFGALAICLGKDYFINFIDRVLSNQVPDCWGWTTSTMYDRNDVVDDSVELAVGNHVKITNHFNVNYIGLVGRIVEITPHSVWIIDSDQRLYFSFATNLEILN